MCVGSRRVGTQAAVAAVRAWTASSHREQLPSVRTPGNVCPPTDARHFADSLYVIETGAMRLLMWGDNRPAPGVAGCREPIGRCGVTT